MQPQTFAPASTTLVGRIAEQATVEQLLDGARDGRSSAVVIRGEAGIGKSTLLEHASTAAAGMRVLTATGIESEAELAFAGLNLLLHEVADRVDALPDSQARALRPALGITSADRDDRFLVGMAVLTLLADLAEERPLLCLIDDAHWLDAASADALLFAARRLKAEGVVMLFAARSVHAPPFPAPGLPELRLSALDDAQADELLTQRAADLPSGVRDYIRMQAQGNPLALLELSVAQREGHLTDGPFGMLATSTLGYVEQTFAARVAALPPASQTLLLVAAADNGCDFSLVLDAAGKLGATLADAEPAEQRQLIRFTDGCLRFRHPLIRNAVYHSATLQQRIDAHQALAAQLGDCSKLRAWHLAAAATGPDESVAQSLEISAECSRDQGGYAAVAAGYERAARLSPDAADRGRRLVAAASAALSAGQFDRSARFADEANALVTDVAKRAELAQVRATLTNWQGNPLGAHRIWVDAAVESAAEHPDDASYMLFHAAEAGWIAADHDAVTDAARRAADLRLPNADRVAAVARAATGAARVDHIADGTAALRRLLDIAQRRTEPLPPQDACRVVWWHLMLGDHTTALQLAEQVVRRCRTEGALGVLARALGLYARAQMFSGRHRDASANAAEGLRIADELGTDVILAGAPIGTLNYLAAITGDEATIEALQLRSEAGQRYGITLLAGIRGLADVSLGRFESAVDRLSRLAADPNVLDNLSFMVDLAEAAARIGQPELAREPLDRYAEWARHTGQPWAEAVALRGEALLGADADAEQHLKQAVELHRRPGGRPFEQARTELVYGEWLRRHRRRSQARGMLRSAHEAFTKLGTTLWADRAGSELRATGESTTVRHGHDRLAKLTPQELQVVRLAAGGMSNREIGGQLFLSPRTVGYHLYKAYPKLGVASRGELAALDLS